MNTRFMFIGTNTRKNEIRDLALLGGPPAFKQTLHVGRPEAPFGSDCTRLMSRIHSALDRRWLSNHGPLVSEFEKQVAHITGACHAISVCNSTIGLQLVAKACGLQGEVILPSFTFIATAHALSWIGLAPVFADVTPDRHTIDPAEIESLITPQTSAIVGVHLWGNPCATEAIETIAKHHQLQVFYDAAHAFGCTNQGRKIGTNGRAEVFSFHASKFVSCGEGGAVTTDDDELAERIRRMARFGFADIDCVSELGINAKMSELSAAFGLTSLEMMEQTRLLNRIKYELYEIGLAGAPGVRMLPRIAGENWNFHYLALEIDAVEAGLSRDQMCDLLWAEGVLARRYFYPGCHRAAPYASQEPNSERPLPVTDRLSDSILILPTGPAVTQDEIPRVCELLRFFIEHSAELREFLHPPSVEFNDFPVDPAMPAEEIHWPDGFLPAAQTEPGYTQESLS